MLIFLYVQRITTTHTKYPSLQSRISPPVGSQLQKKEMVQHFFLSDKLPLGHAPVSFKHNNTAFPCFHKGFKFWLCCTKALYVHLRTVNESIPTVGLLSNYLHRPSVNSWNLLSLATLHNILCTPGNSFIIISLLAYTVSPLLSLISMGRFCISNHKEST